jgi:hypothetical protein
MPERRALTPRADTLVVDLAFGVLAKSLATVGHLTRPAQAIGRPFVHVALRPPLVPSGLQPATWLARAARRGHEYRGKVLVDVEALLDQLIPTVAAHLLNHVDLDHLVKENMDVATLAQEVIDEIDLPAIIRSSTGAVASETLLGVRMQSITGDEAIGRAMDRLRLRLGRRVTQPRNGATDEPGSDQVIQGESRLAMPPPSAPRTT